MNKLLLTTLILFLSSSFTIAKDQPSKTEDKRPTINSVETIIDPSLCDDCSGTLTIQGTGFSLQSNFEGIVSIYDPVEGTETELLVVNYDSSIQELIVELPENFKSLAGTFSISVVSDDKHNYQAIYPITIGAIGLTGGDGADGATGPQGELGDRGPQGVQGNRGLQGPQGELGDRGPQGVQGDRGLQGPQGELGDRGPQGESGTSQYCPDDNEDNCVETHDLYLLIVDLQLQNQALTRLSRINLALIKDLQEVAVTNDNKVKEICTVVAAIIKAGFSILTLPEDYCESASNEVIQSMARNVKG